MLLYTVAALLLATTSARDWRTAACWPEVLERHHSRGQLDERDLVLAREPGLPGPVRDVEPISRVRAEEAHVAAAHEFRRLRAQPVWCEVVVVVPCSYKFSGRAREAGVALGAEALARRVREVADVR